MDESPDGCWTVHHSIVEYQGQWYLFYHDKDLSPNFDKNRSVRADYLSFNEDGTIKKVIPTFRGVGIVDAKSKIQIDRYSDISTQGVSVSFLNETNTFEGWKISLEGTNAWIRFDRVDFGKRPLFGRNNLKSVNVRSASSTGGLIEIHLDKMGGPLLAQVKIKKSSQWKVVNAKLTTFLQASTIFLSFKKETTMLNWIGSVSNRVTCGLRRGRLSFVASGLSIWSHVRGISSGLSVARTR